MSTVSNRKSKNYKLGVNKYDLVSSALVSLLIMIGTAVGALLVVFFFRSIEKTKLIADITPFEYASRPADAAMGLKRDLEPPGLEDVPELKDPQLQETLSALSNAMSLKTAILSDEAIDSDSEAGHGKGLGDSRAAGIGGDGIDGQEPVREIRYEPSSLSEYAKWLDYYKIELAVLDQANNMIYYASNLSRAQPTVRSVSSVKGDGRLRFISANNGSLAPLDRTLARKAGILRHGRLLIQFYPNEAAGRLVFLERQKAGAKRATAINRTIFKVVRNGSDYDFAVAEQTYR